MHHSIQEKIIRQQNLCSNLVETAMKKDEISWFKLLVLVLTTEIQTLGIIIPWKGNIHKGNSAALTFLWRRSLSYWNQLRKAYWKIIV